jgi:hypothetical protein
MTPDYLRSHLAYDPETGIFRWHVRRRGIRPDSDVAGYQAPDRRCYVTIDGVRYFAHRLAWFYVHGRWPSVAIDHIDGDPSNNRLANLREATLSQNQHNQRSGARKGTSRYLGVHWAARRSNWVASIKHQGKTIYIGAFPTEEAAAAAYVERKRQLHFIDLNAEHHDAIMASEDRQAEFWRTRDP